MLVGNVKIRVKKYWLRKNEMKNNSLILFLAPLLALARKEAITTGRKEKKVLTFNINIYTYNI